MLSYIFSWNALYWVLMPFYVVSCLGLIVFVLLQKGKGTGFAGAFGAGGTEAVFGPRSSRSLPQRITYIMAGVFMVLSLCLSMLSGKVTRGAAPALVDETAVTQEAAGASKIDDLFSAPGEAAPAESAATTVTTPVTVTPVSEAPAADAAADAEAAAPVVVDGAAENAAPAEVPAEPAAAPEAAAPAPEAAPAAETPAEAPAETPAQ